MEVVIPVIVAIETDDLVDGEGYHFRVWIFWVTENEVYTVDDITISVVVKYCFYDSFFSLQKVESWLM